MELTIPFSDTGRKYGYIIWPRGQHEQLRSFLGAVDAVTLLLPGDVRKCQRIDWARRRISVGYSMTRALSLDTRTIHLKTLEPGCIAVSFR